MTNPTVESQRIVLCLVADQSALERSGTSIRYLQVGLVDEPIDVILVVPEGARGEDLAAGAATVVTWRPAGWPLERRRDRDVAARVRTRVDALRHEGVAIVHGLSVSTASLAAEITRTLDAELLVTVSSLDDPDRAHLHGRFEGPAAVIATSDPVRRALANSPWAGAAIETIRPGDVAAETPAAFRTPGRSPTLVCHGPLTNDCGVESLLVAAKRVVQVHPSFLAFMVGKGPAEAGLRRRTDALGLRTNVTFTGRLDRWQHAIDAADMFCLPRRWTSVGQEPIRALAAGLAVVAAEDSALDCIIPERTALTYPEHDDVQLAACIQRFIEDPAFARKLAAQGQSHVREHHSVGKMVAGHVQLYHRIAGRHRTHSIAAHR